MNKQDTNWFQTTGFTCGPAGLMRALAALDPSYTPSRLEEITIWREANMVFADRTPAGCGPYGLALAAIRRGARAEIFEHEAEDIFIPLTTRPADADAQKMLTAHDRGEALRRGARIEAFTLTAEFIRAQLAEGKKLMVLTGQDLDGHWVGIDSIAPNDDVTIFDPYKAQGEELKNPLLSDKGVNTFSYETFAAMTRYGPRQGTVVLAFSR